MPTDTEIAWAAGLFEGEGSFGYWNGRSRATMTLTDLDVLRRFSSIVGHGTIGDSKVYQSHHKQRWIWWSNGDGFTAIFEMFKPYLGMRRLAAGMEAAERLRLNFEKLTVARVCPCCGSTYRPSRRRAAWLSVYCSVDCRTKEKNKRRRERLAARPLTPRRRTMMLNDKIERTAELYLSGMPEREIARVLGCSRGGVTYRLQVAKVPKRNSKETGLMAVNRSVFKPARAKLPGDSK